VVSPHLDDAILSLGGEIFQRSRAGSEVSIVTVFAGEPDSLDPAGPWDRRCGFATAGEAARARRREDAAACGIVGARPHWLPFPDGQYGAHPRSEVGRALAPLLGSADLVLTPGFPLVHPDHPWVTALVVDAADGPTVGCYLEQPYASTWALRPELSARGLLGCAAGLAALRLRRRRGPISTPALRDGRPAVRWSCCAGTRTSREAKRRALRQYASQRAALGTWTFAQIRAYEWAAGGEHLVVPSG
jgi:LmbE family N-acetylglucosaminyl deacetylase